MTRSELHAIQQFLRDQIEEITLPGCDVTLRYIDPRDLNMLYDFEELSKPGDSYRINDYYSLRDIIDFIEEMSADRTYFVHVSADAKKERTAKMMLKKEGMPIEKIDVWACRARMLVAKQNLLLRDAQTFENHRLLLRDVIHALDNLADIYIQTSECSKLHAICKVFDEMTAYDYAKAAYDAIIERERKKDDSQEL